MASDESGALSRSFEVPVARTWGLDPYVSAYSYGLEVAVAQPLEDVLAAASGSACGCVNRSRTPSPPSDEADAFMGVAARALCLRDGCLGQGGGVTASTLPTLHAAQPERAREHRLSGRGRAADAPRGASKTSTAAPRRRSSAARLPPRRVAPCEFTPAVRCVLGVCDADSCADTTSSNSMRVPPAGEPARAVSSPRVSNVRPARESGLLTLDAFHSMRASRAVSAPAAAVSSSSGPVLLAHHTQHRREVQSLRATIIEGAGAAQVLGKKGFQKESSRRAREVWSAERKLRRISSGEILFRCLCSVR